MGSISKRGNAFRAYIRLKGFESESKSFETRKEAKEWLTEREQELRKRRLDAPDLLLDEVFRRYISEIAPKRRMADSHLGHDVPGVRRRIQGMTVVDLVGNGVFRWVTGMTDLSPSSRNWILSRLCGVLMQAEMHLGLKFPWEDIRICRAKLKALGYINPGRPRERRVSDAEISAIKRHLPRQISVRMADIIDFCLQSSMRIAEVCRLEWKDLDEVQRTIVIRDRKHPTKKFGNHCVVPLLNGSFETLLRQPRRSERVFPHHPTNISYKFHQAAMRAGIEDVVLHDLRHEGISRLFELGFSIQEVSLVSGHTEWSTLRRYTHLRPAGLVQREQELRALAKKTGARKSPPSRTIPL